MYTSFFGLREKPFSLSPDPRFLFLSGSHREALAHLLYGIEQGEGFITITGEVGTGKTTICRTLLERLGSGTEVAFLFNPSGSGVELLQAIAGEFGLESVGRNRTELNDLLNRFLLEKKREGKSVLLIVDEAQNLSTETLEQVRLLSNLETSSSKLIQILLLGQPELDRKLDSPELRQLRQRISVRWNLGSLTARETHEYVRHRIRIAASGDRGIFSDAALREIYRRTAGVPRLINVLCDRSLLAAYGSGKQQVSAGTVKDASREIPDARRRLLWSGGGWQSAALIALLLSASLAAGFAAVTALLGGAGWNTTAPHTAQTAQTTLNPETPQVASAPRMTPLAVAPVSAARLDPLASIALAVQSAESLQSAESTAQGAESAEPAAGSEETLTWPDSVASAFLDELLAAQQPGAARLHAMNAILDSYHLARFQTAPKSTREASEWLMRRGLTVHRVDDANIEMLRLLNHPALLELSTDRDDFRLVSLSRLTSDTALLYGALGSGELKVAIREISRHWDGRAWIVWQSFEPIPRVLTLGEHGGAVEWLQGALAELGYYAGQPSGRFDRSTFNGVRALQVAHRLEPDGAVGPRTQMLLYDLLQRYDVPRLESRGGAG